MALNSLNSVAGFSTGANANVVIDANANITANALSVTGISNLNDVANVIINGGFQGQVLTTNGAGGLSWAAVPSGNSIANGSSNVTIPVASGNIVMYVNGGAIANVTSTGVNVFGTLNATGNANVGNLGTAQVLATANITAPQLISNVSTGTAPLVVSSTTLVSNLNADLLDGLNSATANTASTIAARDSSGNLSANFFIGNGSQLTGLNTATISNGNSNVNIPAANGNINLAAVGNTTMVITGTGANITGTLNASGNANVGNIGTAQVLATANITAPQLISNVSTGTAPLVVSSTTLVANLNANVLQGNAPATANTASTIALRDVNGNISANFFIGNGSQLTGITSSQIGNLSVISNGNSNVSIPAANGNVNISAVGNTTLVVTGTGANITGTANISGNANVGNVGAAQVLATANITTPQLISNVAAGTAPLVVTSNTLVTNLNADLLDGYQPATTSTANTIALRDTNGNITANFFIGNGSQLTGITASQITGVSSISNGTSNVNIPGTGGNVNTSVGGNANVFVVTGTGANVNGTFTAPNITIYNSSSNPYSTTLRSGSAASSNLTLTFPDALTYATGAFVSGTDGNIFTLPVSSTGSGNIPFDLYPSLYTPILYPNQLTVNAFEFGTGSLPNATTYYFKVVGYDQNGNPTAPSSEVAVTTTTPSSAIFVDFSSNTYVTGLNPAGVAYTKYRVWWGTAPNGQNRYFETILSTYTLTNASAGSAGTISLINRYPSVYLSTISPTLGNSTAPAWGANGVGVVVLPTTITDNTTPASTTVPNAYMNLFDTSTYKATNTAVTVTNLVGTYFNDPAAGTNVTATNRYALGANTLLVTGSANVGNLGAATAVITTGNITTINSGLMQNGNSNVNITANGNVTINAVGGARITATSAGANVTGTLGVSGNANVGNLGAAQVLATANVTAPQLISNVAQGTAPFLVNSNTVVANLNANLLNGATSASANTASTIALRDTSGNISANFFIGNGSQLTGITASQITGVSSIANGTTSVSIPTAGGNVVANIGGTANVLILTTTGANVTGTLRTGGLNLSAASWTTNGVGLIQSAATFTDNTTAASGTVAAAYMNYFAPQTYAASNTGVTVTSLYGTYFSTPVAGTNVTATARYGVGADSIVAITTLATGGAGSLSVGAGGVTIAGGGFTYSGAATNFAVSAQTSGLITLGGTSGIGIITLGQSTVSQTTNIQAGATASGSTKTINIGTGGVSGSTTTIAIGSANGTSITVNGNATFTGNIIGTLANGNSTVSIPAANGNVNITAVGNTTLVVTGTGANITGTVNATGNANLGNLGTAQVLASANITAPQIISNVATGTAPLVVTSNTLVTNLNADLLDGFNTATAATANTVAVRDTNGNITANFFIGNGSQLTGITASQITGVTSISNGNSNVSIPSANGNINISATGNTTLVVTDTGVNVAGTLNATGNANIGNLAVTGTTTTRLDPRTSSQANVSTSITPNVALFDMYIVTAQNGGNIILNTPTGAPVQGSRLMFRFKDNGTIANISPNATSYRNIGVTVPSTTTANKITYIGCIYNSNDTVWDIISVTTQT